MIMLMLMLTTVKSEACSLPSDGSTASKFPLSYLNLIKSVEMTRSCLHFASRCNGLRDRTPEEAFGEDIFSLLRILVLP